MNTDNIPRPRTLAVRFRHSAVATALLALLPVVSSPVAAELYFPPSMVSADAENVADLSRLSQSGAQLPGTYEVEVYLNGNWLVARSVRFDARETETEPVPAASPDSADSDAVSGVIPGQDVRDHTGLLACLTPEDWRDIGLKLEAVPAMRDLPEDSCVSPGRYIPQAYTAFDFEHMRLDISLPQALLHNRPRGWIPPERWDEGINALVTGYRLSGSESHGEWNNTRNLYLSLDNSLNLGAWRLHDTRSWSYNATGNRTTSQWSRLNTYLERAVIPWRSRLLLGEASTDGELFDAFAFRGVKLTTDDSMYPDTLRGFAPVIKGAAFSNARVTVRQNGSLIYQTFVPPGAFAIDDLYPVSSGGDLEVTVTEADSSARTFTVPYSSVPLLQREGRLRWSVAAGRFRSNSDRYDTPAFATGTLQWGLPHGITAYGGVQLAEKYRAGMLGSGVNLGHLGALSADVTHAESELADGSHHSGQSLRLLYARSMSRTGTTLRLAGYRYSTEGFHTLEETALKSMQGRLYDDDATDADGRPLPSAYGNQYNLYNAKRMRVQANLTQRLGKYGSLYLTGTRQTYHRRSGSTDSLTAGYTGTAGPVNWSLSWSYSKNAAQSDRMLYLSFSLPFSALLPWKQETPGLTRLTGNMSRSGGGQSSYMAGMSGSLLQDNNLNWSVQEGVSRQGDGGRNENSGNASVEYRGTYGSVSLGYSHSPDYRQVNYGLSGGMVLHRNGLTLGQQPGVTNVLVAVPGAAGIPVSGGTGIRTDWRGYALLPYSSAYRENTVALDMEGLDEFTEVEDSSTRVVPTRGALVRAEFTAHTGVRALMTLTHNGRPLPFGATVTGDGVSGITGDDGEVYLAGLAQEGDLTAQWGSESHQKCTAHYRLTDAQMAQSPVLTAATCR